MVPRALARGRGYAQSVRITTEFQLAFPVEQSWAFLQDFTSVTSCVPGAHLTELVGDLEARGELRLKLWVVSLHARGVVRVVQHDPATHQVVLRAEGADDTAVGHISDDITLALVAGGPGTIVQVTHDIAAFGGLAAYGHGITTAIIKSLTQQFARCVAARISGGAGVGS